MFSKTRPWISLLLLIALALVAQPAVAQEEEPPGPTYIVQPGDTLSSIALRFNIYQNEIIEASGITNPDALNVGDVLVLPGLDWIDGTLVFEDLSLGETYTSIKRRYLLSDESMALLNRLTSPNQLFLGFNTLLATDRGELTNAARAAIAPGQTLLELAVSSGDNPWALQAYNQLPGTWGALPGDVLFTPGRQAAGPGALPSPLTAFNVDGGDFIQGKTAVLRASGSDAFALTGEWTGKTIHFFANEGGLVALQGTPLTANSDTFPLTISGTTAEGAPFGFSQLVRVQSGNYPTESLSLTDLSTLDNEISSAETARVTDMVLEATPEKRWTGYWGAPHPYIDVINSEFGVQRTYNQGAYESFHYGVDFGGGVGIEIWAPAPGQVVFTGLLDVRGNVTIIDHGWGVYTGYFHQSEILVEVGQQVNPGDLIGRVGNTGRSTGAHLHWEVWVGGVSVEPLDWLAFVFP